MSAKKVRTTISLPEELLDSADRAVREGATRSRNELLASALRRELGVLERRRIDEAFASMAEDADHQQETEKMAEEFAISDWEALQEPEGDRQG